MVFFVGFHFYDTLYISVTANQRKVGHGYTEDQKKLNLSMFPLEMLPWELVKDREITHPEQALPTEGFWVEDLSYTNRNSELEYHIEHCVENINLPLCSWLLSTNQCSTKLMQKDAKGAPSPKQFQWSSSAVNGCRQNESSNRWWKHYNNLR